MNAQNMKPDGSIQSVEDRLNEAIAEAVLCLEAMHGGKWRVSVRHDLRMVTILGPRPVLHE